MKLAKTPKVLVAKELFFLAPLELSSGAFYGGKPLLREK
jgi:hypothetical protein